MQGDSQTAEPGYQEQPTLSPGPFASEISSKPHATVVWEDGHQNVVTGPRFGSLLQGGPSQNYHLISMPPMTPFSTQDVMQKRAQALRSASPE
eukprot:CAMPEP_0184297188 /NCGR_PEP_ID=MMETSP1049-20130417/8115_1 /TAXON_ID=77928 /ORGANISM="Proteomonas sulcata, Strain CCMP704" /LENGTH=92 /DNA_ID=CAMNT_0026606791 /DNA_START=402 /DNA_END=680 /DNA_ORIENTATION=+